MIGGPPDLSIVIAATDSPRSVDRLLESLAGQVGGVAEILVVAAFGPTGLAPKPGVRWITAPPGTGVPRLRRLGLEDSRGRVVVFTEDSVLVDPGWVEAWLATFEDPRVLAASGLVDHDPRASAIDWAVVFCEYAPFFPSSVTHKLENPTPNSPLSPWERVGVRVFPIARRLTKQGSERFPIVRGSLTPTLSQGEREEDHNQKVGDQSAPPSRLAGNNFAVDRQWALRLTEGGEVHETPLLASILRGGGLVRTVDRAVVRHVRNFGPGEAFGDRFRFGFEFGQLRADGLSTAGRLAGWVAGPAIFAVQVGRLLSTMLRNGRHLGPFLRSLPITLAMLAAWSLGEWAGWCRGPSRRNQRSPASPTPSPGWERESDEQSSKSPLTARRSVP
ncbi:glycosyltransferase family 2 protein [Tundrisphaera lichenicola]|uniref:glycosyltransferase family 2 protein n=1 Tax=Tundrisphaera lichenicola TaxID=2029860 RepID=UPI003EB97D8A